MPERDGVGDGAVETVEDIATHGVGVVGEAGNLTVRDIHKTRL